MREIVGLCAGKTKTGKQCMRTIKGYGNGFYFLHWKFGYIDLRNRSWSCWQHRKGN